MRPKVCNSAGISSSSVTRPWMTAEYRIPARVGGDLTWMRLVDDVEDAIDDQADALAFGRIDNALQTDQDWRSSMGAAAMLARLRRSSSISERNISGRISHARYCTTSMAPGRSTAEMGNSSRRPTWSRATAMCPSPGPVNKSSVCWSPCAATDSFPFRRGRGRAPRSPHSRTARCPARRESARPCRRP